MSEPSARLLKAAKALVASISFDDSGIMLGQVQTGGNGGLISHDTLMKTDELRRAIAAFEEKPDV